MPINQPPISDDPVLSSWQYEITALANEQEQITQRRASRGPEEDMPTSADFGAEYYDTTNHRWYKYDTEDGWILIGEM